MKRHHYTYDQLVAALRSVGLCEGDTVFGHVSLLPLGFPKLRDVADSPGEILRQALAEVLGHSGTFFTPAYTYSFCKGESFDPSTTPSAVGPFAEWLRKQPAVYRSHDPIFSLLGQGGRAKQVLGNLPHNCFGEDCAYARLHALDAKICNIGLNLVYLTPIHHLEKTVGVPYRFDKEFSGTVTVNGMSWTETWTFYVRVPDERSQPDCSSLERAGFAAGLCRVAPLGLNSVRAVSMRDYFALAREQLRRDPYFLVKGADFA